MFNCNPSQCSHRNYFVTLLNSEIQGIKNSRVKLMRQIKEENAKYQALKKEKEREVKQLKEKVR